MQVKVLTLLLERDELLAGGFRQAVGRVAESLGQMRRLDAGASTIPAGGCNGAGDDLAHR